MKKYLPLMLCLSLFLTACASAQTLTGKAQGYGGELTVQVTMDGETIKAVDVTAHNETANIGGTASAEIAKAIVENNSADVDVISGATVTSNAVMQAVKNAINPNAAPNNEGTTAPAPTAPLDGQSIGFGVSSMGRVGPGTDAENVPVYSFNVVMANATFDQEGRIVDLLVDQLEVATPNYDGAGMPSFSGFPGQGGYNYDEAKNGSITGKTPDTEEFFLKEIEEWQTKRQRGEGYRMTTGTWASQMDAYQGVFIGKTVAEIEEWFNSFCSDVNGRPLKADSADEKDKAKYDALSEENRQMLADVTTSATMSLNDSHGNIIAAIRNAYDNRVGIPR